MVAALALACVAGGVYTLANLLTHAVVKPVIARITSKSRQDEIFKQIEYKSRLDQDVLRLNKQLDKENLLLGKQLDKENLLLGKLLDQKNLLLGKQLDKENLLLGKQLDKENLLLGKQLDKENLLLGKQLDKENLLLGKLLDQKNLLLGKQLDFENTIKIQEYSHYLRLIEANQQFNSQVELWNLKQFNESMWPLKTPFGSQFLNLPVGSNALVPINIFLAKTEPESPYSKLFQDEVKQLLSGFLQNYYQDHNHPIVSRIGDWKEGFQDDAFINALWYGLKGQPTIVVNPVQTTLGNNLRLNVSFWGLGDLSQYSGSPGVQRILDCQYKSMLGNILREETLRWRDSGFPFQSQLFEHNLQLLQKEEKLLADGKTQDELEPMLSLYQLAQEIGSNVIERFSREFAIQLAFVAGMYSDVYYLLEYGTPPRLPQAIRDYNVQNNTNLVLPPTVIDHYQKTLTSMACCNYFQDKLPMIYLGVAQEIKDNSERAEEILCEGVGLWESRKTIGNNQRIDLPKTFDDCIQTICDKFDEKDGNFLSKAREVLGVFNKSFPFDIRMTLAITNADIAKRHPTK